MSSNYEFCGFDMQDPNSKAGRALTGLNLNSVTVQYMLKNNPVLAQQVYLGIAPSYYGEMPRMTESTDIMADQLPEMGDNMNPVNPMDLVKQAHSIPTAQFQGAMNPLAMYRDAVQPTAFAPNQTMGMYPYGSYGYYGQVPYNYNPANPMVNITRNDHNSGIMEWNDYQRKQGFRAKPPLETDFPEDGFLSGFHQGFDPYGALAPQENQDYDVTMGGKLGISSFVHENMLKAQASVWGWQPGQLIDRREFLMFPGVNENHRFDSRPAKGEVLDYNGFVQRPRTNDGLGSRPSTSLPVSNMVSTNPFMRGVQNIGGYGSMWNPTGPVPSLYMQARFNYAIANGFQSVQEMDNNDFRVLKRVAKVAHNDLSDEEFDKKFDETWCKPLVKAKELREPPKGKTISIKDNIPKMKVRLMKGDKVLAGFDATDDRNHNILVQKVATECRVTHEDPNIRAQAQRINEWREYQRDEGHARLHAQAPERKYDNSGMLEFMEHGFVESFMYLLEMQHYNDMMNPEKRRKRNKIDQTAFLRNCMQRGMGIGLPAATARLQLENKLFRVDEDLTDEAEGKPRGSYGVDANGKEDLDIGPLYGYTSYIPDPENPEHCMPFPRRYIREIYDGYIRYCNVANSKSKSARITPMNYEDFSKVLGVDVMDDESYDKKYAKYNPGGSYVAFSKESLLTDPTAPNIFAQSILKDRDFPREDDDEESYNPDSDIPPLDVLEDQIESDGEEGKKWNV